MPSRRKNMWKRQLIITIAFATTCFPQRLTSLAVQDSQEPALAAPFSARGSKVEAALRQKLPAAGTVRIFVALSQRLDSRRVGAIKRAYAPQIRALDEESRRATVAGGPAENARRAA